MKSLFNINFSWIFGSNNKVTQDCSENDSSEKLYQTLNSKLVELQKSSPYSINAVEVNSTNIHPQEGLIKRDAIIAEVCGLLDENRCVILNGEILVGKTSLAELLGLARTELHPLMLRLSYNSTLDPCAIISSLAEQDACKLLVIDGLPDYTVELTETIFSSIQRAIDSGLRVLITARSFSTYIASKYIKH